SWCEEELTRDQVAYLDLNPQYAKLPQIASIWSGKLEGTRSIVNPPRTIVPCLADRLQPVLHPELDIILLDGFHLEAALETAHYGQKQGIPVVLDGGSWKPGLEELLPLIDVAICSADFRGPGGEPAWEILAAYDVEAQVVTKGSAPVEWKDGPKITFIPVPEIEAVDSLGAGDVFHGAFCYAYAQDRDMRKALEKGIEVAAQSVQYFGAQTWARR
ncbi:MAG: PfkB family carbohydrate kinase, partial [Bacteroidota bacterium]